MRLIDADKLLEVLNKKSVPFNANVNDAILTAPTIDAAGVGKYEKAIQKLREMPRCLNGIKAKQIKKIPPEAEQGEWIVREYCTNELDYRKWIEIECPFCGEKPTYENLDNMNFCPNCGADMRPKLVGKYADVTIIDEARMKGEKNDNN